MNNSKRLINRIHIMSQLDMLIKESVYHRTHSDEFEVYDPMIIGSVNEASLKAKIL